MSSISSILSGTTHAAFSHRMDTTSASSELQNLFAKLHLDAIASTAATTTPASTTTPSTSSDAVTGLVSGLRHLLDGGVSLASNARTAINAYTGGGTAGLAGKVLEKLA